MSTRITLNPINIIGSISVNTPYFVLKYISRLCKRSIDKNLIGVDEYYLNVIETINTFVFPEIDHPNPNSSDSDLSKLIKFISPFQTSREWDVESLIDAYNHLYSYSGEKLPIIHKNNLVIGDKTPDNPFSLNQLICYIIAKRHNYNMNRFTSFQEIEFFIRNLIENRVSSIKNSLLHTINSMTNTEILKLYHTVSQDCDISINETELEIQTRKETKFMFDIRSLELFWEKCLNPTNLIKDFIPRTNYDAIIIAALLYDVDISESSYPLGEIDKLKMRRYIPYCPRFSKLFSMNKKYYKVSKTWRENLSEKVYTNDRLIDFATNEGFNNLKGMTNQELNTYMKSTQSMFNFYFGIIPNCESKKTIVMMDPIDEHPSEEIICCGIIKTGNLYYTTIHELYSYFTKEKMYVDMTLEKNLIDERVINKLRRYCISKNVGIFKDMLVLLDNLERVKKLIDIKVRDLKVKLSKSDPEILEKVDRFFYLVMEMGLYMRGWKIDGSNIYPLRSENTCVDNDGMNSLQIQENTVKAYETAKDFLCTLPHDIREDIECLNTLRFNRNEKSYFVFGMNFKGTTIYRNETLLKCMSNIYGGIHNNESCLRTNSNWILYSSCWYRFIFGFTVPFEMDQIDDIK